MQLIGLTGNIASGKSVVATLFKSYGAHVIDADQIARDVVQPGKPAYNSIIQEFGVTILKQDKTIDRDKLANIVFDDEKKRKRLNSIVHPEVATELLRRVSELAADESVEVVVIEAALLFEAGAESLVNKTVVVWCDEETQIQRLMERDGISEEAARSRIASQMPAKEKRKRADYLIETNGPMSDTINRAMEVYKAIIA